MLRTTSGPSHVQRLVWAGIVATLLAGGAGCKQKMSYQPRYDPLERSETFNDRSSARPPVAGTVARGFLRDDPEVFLGRKENGDYVTTFPFPVTEEVLKRGQERFTIYCTMCHGFSGYGNGMIVQRGFSPPPSFHDPETREKSVGYYFAVITNGYGAMPGHAHQIPVSDRWAIVAYVRALQLSQNARPEDVPADQRQRLDAQPTPPAAPKPAASPSSSHSGGTH
ncbi:cytochrome c [Chloracidobacterium aggregatum]|jgi:mono/diheme cytochrome c family protein|uniref:c-type cytochrome n=1 Tax=Chloracidobacterium aggregatum TaxID=2851959 RepID=UPI001FE9976D|nr:cytochrome c [Chloracidobacterium aggregatum]